MDTDNGLCPKHGADLISNLVSLIITQTFSLLLLSFLEGGWGGGGEGGGEEREYEHWGKIAQA